MRGSEEGDKQPVERFKERGEEKEVGEKVKRKNECLKGKRTGWRG